MDLVLLTRKQLVHIEVYMFKITQFSFRNERLSTKFLLNLMISLLLFFVHLVTDT